MNKTLTINLAGFMFHIDENAYKKLERYLSRLKAQFAKTEGGEEIIQDIESRIAELFKEKITDAKEVISSDDVDSVIAVMGQPEDYMDADEEAAQQERTYRAKEEPQFQSSSRSRTIYRDTDSRIIGGVSAGLGHYFKLDAIWMRLIFIALFFSGFGTLLYIILWIVVPKARTTTEKLQMRGERVNISNIEKSIREEMDAVGGKVKDFTDKARNHDYTPYRKSTTGFFNDLGRFIGMAVRTLIRVIGKVLGFLLILFAFGLLIALLIAMGTGGFHLLGSDVGLFSVLDFLELVTVSAFHYNSMIIGLLLVTVAPVFLFVYLGLRLLFNLQPLNASARNGALLSIFAGIIILIITGSVIGASLSSRGSFTQRHELVPQQDTINISVIEDEVYQAFEAEHFNPRWMYLDGQHLFTNVELDVLSSVDSVNYLVAEVRANGSNRREARAFTEDISFNYKMDGQNLKFANYYTLANGKRFKGQSIRYRLYLTEGTRIFLDENTIDLIYDIKNTDDLWDHHMVNHWWEMTSRGLECLDCVEERQRRRKEIRWPEQAEDEIEQQIEQMEQEIEQEVKQMEQELENEMDQLEEELKQVSHTFQASLITANRIRAVKQLIIDQELQALI
jgi:phage shock protein PspC (stress-responsive transcriptional regulator)